MRLSMTLPILLTGFVVGQGCGGDHGTAGVTEIGARGWNANVLQGMRIQWREEIREYQLSAMRRKLRSEIGVCSHQLLPVIDLFAVPAPSGIQDFTEQLKQAILVECMATGNRECLVRMLSVSCPSSFDMYCPIEYWLATSITMHDPILVLVEAYSSAVSEENRRTIYDRLRLAFASARIQGKDDGKFVEECRTWYLKNRRMITVNMDYVRWQPHVVCATPSGDAWETRRDTVDKGLYVVRDK